MQFLAIQVNSASGGMHDPLKFRLPHSLIISPDIAVRPRFFHCYTETLVTKSDLPLKAYTWPFSNLWVKACINAISVTVFLFTFFILAVPDHLMTKTTATHLHQANPAFIQAFPNTHLLLVALRSKMQVSQNYSSNSDCSFRISETVCQSIFPS